MFRSHIAKAPYKSKDGFSLKDEDFREIIIFVKGRATDSATIAHARFCFENVPTLGRLQDFIHAEMRLKFEKVQIFHGRTAVVTMPQLRTILKRRPAYLWAQDSDGQMGARQRTIDAQLPDIIDTDPQTTYETCRTEDEFPEIGDPPKVRYELQQAQRLTVSLTWNNWYDEQATPKRMTMSRNLPHTPKLHTE
jgi:hypothetical protein